MHRDRKHVVFNLRLRNARNSLGQSIAQLAQVGQELRRNLVLDRRAIRSRDVEPMAPRIIHLRDIHEILDFVERPPRDHARGELLAQLQERGSRRGGEHCARWVAHNRRERAIVVEKHDKAVVLEMLLLQDAKVLERIRLRH